MKNIKQIISTLFRDKLLFTPSQELLLRASLLKTKEALQAWDEFRSNVDIDKIDRHSLRILPLLYKNLAFHGVKNPLLEKFKGVYRMAWCKNQILFHKIYSVLHLLENAGIKTMILREAPLLLFYYKDYGLRPMADFDVMVRAADLQCAIDLLSGAGWQPFGDRPLNRLTKSVRHAHGFRDAEHNKLNLHWHLFCGYCAADAEDDFWRDSVKMQFNSLPVYVLDPTVQLLHILVHGAQRSAVAGLCWVTDAAMIMNEAQSQIDWQRLIRYAKKMSFVLSVKNSLDYLRRLVGIFVPQEVVRDLEEVQISEIERMAYKAKMHNNGVMGMLPASFYRYLIYAKKERKNGFLKNITTFIEFLEFYWGKERLYQLPATAISKTMKRLGFKISEGCSRARNYYRLFASGTV